jgi:hypothetical protein
VTDPISNLAANPETAKIVGSAVSTITGEAAKVVAQKGVDKVTTIAKKIDDTVQENFEVLGREIRVQCTESVQRYSMALRARKAGLLHSKLRVELGNVRRADLISLRGLESINAVHKLERGFEIDLKKLVAGEEYTLEVEYRIEDSQFLENLVSREVARETPKEDGIAYWMYSQLKFPEALRGTFGRINLRDVPFLVDVDVHKDINTHIPKTLLDRLETLRDLARPMGRGNKFREWDKLRNTQFGTHGKSDLDIVKEVHALFTPDKFRTFVDVTKDYEFYSSEQGASLFDMPFFSWPKYMTVISRADLSLDEPVAEGDLIFKRKKMLEDVEKIFHGDYDERSSEKQI